MLDAESSPNSTTPPRSRSKAIVAYWRPTGADAGERRVHDASRTAHRPVLVTQLSPEAHLGAQDPPQPSSPQTRLAQRGTQASGEETSTGPTSDVAASGVDGTSVSVEGASVAVLSARGCVGADGRVGRRAIACRTSAHELRQERAQGQNRGRREGRSPTNDHRGAVGASTRRLASFLRANTRMADPRSTSAPTKSDARCGLHNAGDLRAGVARMPLTRRDELRSGVLAERASGPGGRIERREHQRRREQPMMPDPP